MSWAVWLTGPPAAGKSTLARAVTQLLAAKGVHAITLESDALRKVLTPRPTYSREERDRFYAALADLAALLVAQGSPVVVDATAPRRAYRQRARRRLERFLEVFVTAPLELREARDPKGLYRMARRGRAPNVPGLGAAYEEPRHPDLVVPGDAPVEAGARAVVALLGARGFLALSP